MFQLFAHTLASYCTYLGRPS